MSTSKRKQRASKERKAAALAAQRAAAERRRRYLIGGSIAGAVVLIALIAVVVSVTGGDSSGSSVATGDTTATTATAGFAYGTAACAPTTPPATPTIDFPDTNGFASCLQTGDVYTATFQTTAGTIVVQLDSDQVPGTVNNFVQLAGWGYYDGTKLFRTDTSIGIIQGGSPHTQDASDPGPGFTIPDEGSGFTYQPGQIVMARGSGANSASAQFFFTVDDKASQLNGQGTYVVFGTVSQGLDVLQKILATNVEGSGGLGGSPNPPVTVTQVIIGRATLTNNSTPPTTATPAPSTADTTPSDSTPSSRDTVPPG